MMEDLKLKFWQPLGGRDCDSGVVFFLSHSYTISRANMASAIMIRTNNY
jgi:hypothetical protein